MIDSFVQYLTVNRGLSSHTVEAYEKSLRCFAAFIKEYHPGQRWSTITKQMVDEWVVTLVADDYSPASIKQYVSALRTFYKTCIAMGARCENPARYVSTPKLEDNLPKTIELEAIHAALDSSLVPSTAKAVISIIYETGLRIQELLDLQPADIDAAARTIRVRGKGRKERVVFYGELTARYGRFWHPADFTQRSVRRLVFNALRPFSHAKQLSPHALRHTYATALLNNGMSIEAVSQLLGHDSIETTQVYARLANPTVRQQYLQFAPC